jgi:uncharacterized repeat protein (TIGR02543 family)
MPDKDVIITGSFAARTYTVSYDLSGGQLSDGSSSVASRRVGYNSTGLIPDEEPVRTGYSFVGWASASGMPITATSAYSQIVANDRVPSVVLFARWQAVGTTTAVSNTSAALPPTTSTTSVQPGSSQMTEELSGTQEYSQMAAQTGNPFVDIANGNVPLGSLDLTGVWSLANMLMAQAAMILAIITGMLLLLRRGRKGPAVVLRAVVCALGVSAPFVWLANDHLSDPMVWFNSWTPIIIALFFVQLLVLVGSVVALFVKRREQAVVAGLFDELSDMEESPYVTL